MARRWLHILIAFLLLAAVSLGSYRWAGVLTRSLYAYRPPFTPPPPAQATTPRLSDGVVLVVIGGLRLDVAADMPTVQRVADAGARGIVRTAVPTYLQPTWTALLTGADPELLAGNLLGEQPWELTPIPGDHLIATAHRAGLAVGLAAHQGPHQLIPETLLQARAAPVEQGLAGDREVIEAAERMWTAGGLDLLVVQLDGLRQVSAESGALGDEALLPAQETDALLGRLLQRIDLRSATLLVTSDRGLTRFGGYGGSEWEVTRVPLAMAGAGVQPADLGEVTQTAVAPTVAALLGAPILSFAQGDVLTAALGLSPDAEEALRAVRATQTASLATFYLASLHADPQAGVGVASSPDPLEAIARYRAQRITAERLNRAALAVAVALLPLLVLLRRPTRRNWYLLFAALVIVAAFHVQLWYGVGSYSFSAVRSIGALLERLIFYALLSCGLGGILGVALLWLDGQRTVLCLWEGLLDLGLLTSYLLSVAVAATFALVGFRPTWFLPDVTLLYAQFLLLLQLALTSAACLALPLPALLVTGLHRGLMALAGTSHRRDSITTEASRAHRRHR